MIDVTGGFIEQFIAMYGDYNPVHRDDEFAKRLSLPGKIAHGASYAGFLSALIGTKLPGPGSIWVAQTYR
ncbi:MAG: MaoC/PaaZ C-terminal domain-containing protein, partial [Chloroflexota bacterium]